MGGGSESCDFYQAFFIDASNSFDFYRASFSQVLNSCFMKKIGKGSEEVLVFDWKTFLLISHVFEES